MTGATTLVRGSDWPVAAGAVLGLLALVEVAIRSDGTGPANLLTALLLGLAGTVPLILARAHLVAVTATLAAAVLVSLLIYQRTTIASLAAFAAAVFLLGRHTLDRRRSEAVAKAASRRVFADTLLAHAARAERARIARELHDVVAHHISMISVQAETARLTTPDLPPEGAVRLQAIGETARAALTEMRRLLGVLREDAGAEPTRTPQPGLAQLVELVDEARAATGGSTRLLVSGQVRRLDPGIELTAYRIVQEALTNARRYAPGAAVDVGLWYGEAALRIRVRDSGPGPADPDATGGHGLVGMRERVAAVGGELRAGPVALATPAGGHGGSGGFMVEARLPVTAEGSE